MDFSVIIINLNGKKILSNCIESILKNNYSSYEIIVVDNNSTDGSLNYIKEKFKSPKIKIISLNNNYGPAYARNKGVKIAKGKFLSFLDNDTVVDPNWLKFAKKEFDNHSKTSCIQSKLLLLNDKSKFDYAGDFLNQFGLLSHRAIYNEVDNGQFNKRAIVFSAKSAGMFIRKNIFNKIKGFDNDYFIYVEETDLCWRSWLKGYKTIYCPNSVVYHGYGGSFKLLKSSFATYNLRFHGTKNYILTMIKNLSTKKLLQILPKQLILMVLFSLYLFFIKFKFNESFFVIKGMCWNIINLSKTIEKRKKIQKNRKISEEELFSYIYKKENIFNKLKTSVFLKT